MTWRFFKKCEPTNLPVIGNGSKVQFPTLDHVWGYHGTNNGYVADELVRLTNEGKYGITEISEAEFHSEFVEKKKAMGDRQLKPLWRDELGNNRHLPDTVFPAAKSAVVAAAEAEHHQQLAARATPVAVNDAPVTSSAAPTEFKPATAKRSQLKPEKLL
jgi:hypothetical protein